MIKAEIVADSLSPQGDRLISVLATFPRIILAEVNTHRMLSKNTSSSRAIPFSKMVEAVKENPFIPIAWQKDHKGMQGSEYFNFNIEDSTKNEIVSGWLSSRDSAVSLAMYMNNKGVTKQLCNRLLEPYMWTTMLITGNLKGGWDNFFELRCPRYEIPIQDFGIQSFKSRKEVMNAVHESQVTKCDTLTDLGWLNINKGAAEIHMMALAESIYDTVNESTPKQLQAGEWHIPFNDIMDTYKGDIIYEPLARVKISTAMAARTSYTIVGEEKEVDYNKLISLHNRLLAQNPPHSSPMEHCALVMNNAEYRNHHKGDLADDNGIGWCRNYKGFIPYRHIVETNTK